MVNFERVDTRRESIAHRLPVVQHQASGDSQRANFSSIKARFSSEWSRIERLVTICFLRVVGRMIIRVAHGSDRIAAHPKFIDKTGFTAKTIVDVSSRLSRMAERLYRWLFQTDLDLFRIVGNHPSIAGAEMVARTSISTLFVEHDNRIFSR